MSILLTSTSLIKLQAVEKFFAEIELIDFEILQVNCDKLMMPCQPVDCGLECAQKRIDYSKTIHSNTNYDLIIAIENDIVLDDNCQGIYSDYANVMIECNQIIGTGRSDGILCPTNILPEHIISKNNLKKYSPKIQGFDITIGDMLHNIDNKVNPKDWMSDYASVPRCEQILTAIRRAWLNLQTNIKTCHDIFSQYMTYPNFPKKDVNFNYFYSLFGKNNMKRLSDLLNTKYSHKEIDIIVPIESRGLVLGTILAEKTGAAMIPLQKLGKIPGEIITKSFTKEYGNDDVALSIDLFEKFHLEQNKNKYTFLIVDDLIATGGTISTGMTIITELSRRYNFLAQVEILALDEIYKLREIAREKISNEYCVLFSQCESAACYISKFGKIN